jgi:nicotinamide phosphoribosyltransferase
MNLENGIIHAIRQKYGIACDTDGYKFSHHAQYRKGAKRMISYIESRGGKYDKVVFFGLQLIIKEYFLQPLTMTQVRNIVEFEKKTTMGNCTDDLEIALTAVVHEFRGKLPIKIRAVQEGMVVPVKNVLVTVESTVDDERLFSLVSYFEAKIQRVWSPMTVATASWHIKQVIRQYLEETSDNPELELPNKLVDFGARAVGGMEVAAFAGAGHIAAGFQASDTTVAIMAFEIGYGSDMAAFTIPASEHSSTTSWGRDGEINLIQQMFDKYAKQGAFFATVIDSYDALKFIRDLVPQFKDRLIASGATWIIRPDSNDPVEMPIKCVLELEKIFGCTVNTKGYKVLNHVRVLQGDGIGPKEVEQILAKLKAMGYSASNMGFGMGGGLLQKNDRDTQKVSMKCCAILTDEGWIDVYKDPATYDEDWNVVEEKSFKTSKRGRLELMHNKQTGEWDTMTSDNADRYVGYQQFGWEKMLEDVFADGKLLRDMTAEQVVANSK